MCIKKPWREQWLQVHTLRENWRRISWAPVIAARTALKLKGIISRPIPLHNKWLGIWWTMQQAKRIQILFFSTRTWTEWENTADCMVHVIHGQNKNDSSTQSRERGLHTAVVAHYLLRWALGFLPRTQPDAFQTLAFICCYLEHVLGNIAWSMFFPCEIWSLSQFYWSHEEIWFLSIRESSTIYSLFVIKMYIFILLYNGHTLIKYPNKKFQ